MIFGKFAAVSGALALGILWPFAMGQIAQVFYEREIALFESPYISISPVEYQRGYLGSEIITEIFLHGKQSVVDNQKKPSFQVITKVKHGFFGIDGQLKILANHDNEISTELMATESNFAVSLLGNANLAVHFSPMQSEVRDLNVNISNLNFKGELMRDGQAFFELSTPSLSLKNENKAMDLHNLILAGQGKVQQGIWVGHQRLSADEIAITGSSTGDWHLLKGKLHFENQFYKSLQQTKSEDWLIDTLAFFSAEKLSNEQEDVLATRVQLGLKMEELDYQSLAIMVKLDDASNDFSQHEMDLAQTALNKLLAKGLKLSMPIDFALKQGQVNALVKLRIDEGATQATNDLSQLFNKMNGNISLTIPKIVVKDNVSLFSALEQQGFLARNLDEIEMHFSLVGDELISNSGAKIAYRDILSLLNS